MNGGERGLAYFVEARRFAVKRAVVRTGDEELAEDLAQEVLIRLAEESPRPRNPEAWITRVVDNLITDTWRARKRRPAEVEYEHIRGRDALNAFLQRMHEPISAMAMSDDSVASIWDEVSTYLTSREIRLLQLTAAGMSQEDIAAQLGYAGADSVKVTLTRIRRKLREVSGERVPDWLEHPRVY